MSAILRVDAEVEAAPPRGRFPLVLQRRAADLRVQLAAQRPVAGVILVAPFDSLVEVGKHYYPFLPVNWMLRHRFDSVGTAPKMTAPLLCILAERDEIIPAVLAALDRRRSATEAAQG